MERETIVITLGKELPDRTRAAAINQRLLAVHKVIWWTIFLGAIYLSIEYQHSTGHHQRTGIYSDLVSVFYYLFQILACMFAAHVSASFVMWIPSFIFARIVPPQILLFDNYMIYVGGSVATQYPLAAQVHAFYRYLLSFEQFHVIARSDIELVCIENAPLSRFMAWGKWIAITHKNGKLLTGNSLSDSFKEEVIGEIRNWLKQGQDGTATSGRRSNN